MAGRSSAWAIVSKIITYFRVTIRRKQGRVDYCASFSKANRASALDRVAAEVVLSGQSLARLGVRGCATSEGAAGWHNSEVLRVFQGDGKPPP